MTKSNRRARMSAKEFGRLVELIEEQLRDVPKESRFKRHSLHEAAVMHGAQTLTIHQLEYMIEEGFLQPIVEEGQIQLFGWEDLRDTILIWTLKERRNFSYTRVATLIYQYDDLVQRADRYARRHTLRPRDVGVMPQRARGHTILRSRMIGVCLSWLFKGSIPPGTVVLMRQQHTHSTESIMPWQIEVGQYDLLESVS